MKECLATATQRAIEASYITPRDALHGGHTEVFREACDVYERDATIEYLDIVSLYPTVNAMDLYPTGKKNVYTGKTLEFDFPREPNESNLQYIYRIINGGFCGFIKIDIGLDQTAHIPVLPQRTKRLEFNNKHRIQETFYSEELKYAIETGQVVHIPTIHAALGYKAQRGLMRDYVCKFLRIKTISSGAKSQEECDAFNNSCKRDGIDVFITPHECNKNPGLKGLAKLYLNHYGGNSANARIFKSVQFAQPSIR